MKCHLWIGYPWHTASLDKMCGVYWWSIITYFNCNVSIRQQNPNQKQRYQQKNGKSHPYVCNSALVRRQHKQLQISFFREKGMKKWHRPSKKEKKKKDENATKISAYKRQLGICCEHFIMYSCVCVSVCVSRAATQTNQQQNHNRARNPFFFIFSNSFDRILPD